MRKCCHTAASTFTSSVFYCQSRTLVVAPASFSSEDPDRSSHIPKNNSAAELFLSRMCENSDLHPQWSSRTAKLVTSRILCLFFCLFSTAIWFLAHVGPISSDWGLLVNRTVELERTCQPVNSRTTVSRLACSLLRYRLSVSQSADPDTRRDVGRYPAASVTNFAQQSYGP